MCVGPQTKERRDNPQRCLAMLTKALAKAWAPEITVNSVAPGVIPLEDIDERGKAMISNTPAQRGGTPAEVADTIARAAKYVPKKHLYPCTNCGMAPMDREIALQKLEALVAGTRLARKKLK